MSDLPQISEAEFKVMKVIWKYAPISTTRIFVGKRPAGTTRRDR